MGLDRIFRKMGIPVNELLPELGVVEPEVTATGSTTVSLTPVFSHGDALRDRVTGLEGVVMAIAWYSDGGVDYGLQSQKLRSDGQPPDWVWLDESRLDLVEAGAAEFSINQDRHSGPMPQGPNA